MPPRRTNRSFGGPGGAFGGPGAFGAPYPPEGEDFDLPAFLFRAVIFPRRSRRRRETVRADRGSNRHDSDRR